MKTYIIEYKCFDHIERMIESGKFKVKNCDSELHAKVKFGEFIKNKIENCQRVQIVSCVDACTNELYKLFGDIFN